MPEKQPEKQHEKPGTLYVVATPIGNLEDLTPRALETLRQADVILAEDTREFRRLAARFHLAAPVLSYHEHNERSRTPALIEKLKNGETLALVSDAGTPCISDPGYHLVRAAHENQLAVRTVPGPSSVTACLSVSGINAGRFTFYGFVPPKSGRRENVLQEALASGITWVFLESPHRILKTLEALARLAPERILCVGRELTKIHEEVKRASAAELYQSFASREAVKGEFVLIIEAGKAGKHDDV